MIDEKETVTDNNRKAYVGKCVECRGRVVRMCGYASLPDIQFSRTVKDDDDN